MTEKIDKTGENQELPSIAEIAAMAKSIGFSDKSVK